MNETLEYSNAYKEVLEVLRNMSESDYNKIPKNMIKVFETYCNKDYNFKYDVEKSFEQQQLSKRAKIILAILFRDYWASPEQKEKILAKEKYDMQQLEYKKMENYNPDDLFKNKVSKVDVDTVQSSDALVEYKESIFTKILNWFKRTF